MTEREYWLTRTRDPDYKRNYISDPNISIDETLKAIVSSFPEPVSHILEIGCGYGRLTVEICKLCPDADVYGIDVNSQLIDEAYRIFRSAKHTDIRCPYYRAQDDLKYLPMQDAIFSVAVFQHLPSCEKCEYIRQAYKLLRSKGVLRIQFIEGSHDNFVDHLITLRTMVKWFKQAGFNVRYPVERGLVHQQWTWITGVKP